MNAVLAPLLLLSLTLPGAAASLQGLYVQTPNDGQLQLVDWTTGAKTDVGTSLKAQGYVVDACAASVIQQTGKFYLSLVKRVGDTNGPYVLVEQYLADGNVSRARELPDVFPTTLTSCEYTMQLDGGFVVFVAAVARGGDGDRFIMVKYADRASASVEVIVDEDLASVGVGTGVRYLTSTALPDGIIWVQFSEGAVAFSTETGARVGAVKLAVSAGTDAVFTRLEQSQRDDLVHGTLSAGGRSMLASFGPYEAVPAIALNSTAFPQVGRDGAASVFISDKLRWSVISRGDLLTFDLTTGTQMSSVAAFCPDADDVCFASWAYLPFVF